MVFKDDDEDEKQPGPKRIHCPANEATMELLQSVSKWEIVGCGAYLSCLFCITALDPYTFMGVLTPLVIKFFLGGLEGTGPEAKNICRIAL